MYEYIIIKMYVAHNNFNSHDLAQSLKNVGHPLAALQNILSFSVIPKMDFYSNLNLLMMVTETSNCYHLFNY